MNKKEWDELKKWLVKIHPSIRLIYLKDLAKQTPDKDIKEEINELILETEDDLVKNPDWKSFGTPAPKGIKIELLFPTLTGRATETLETKVEEGKVPAQTIKDELPEDINLYRPQFVGPFPQLPEGDYLDLSSHYRTMIYEMYDTVKYRRQYQISEEVQAKFGPHMEAMAWAAAVHPELRRQLMAAERMLEESESKLEKLKK